MSIEISEYFSTLVMFLQANAMLLIVAMCIIYFVWSRRPRSSSANTGDAGLYDCNNSKLTTVHEAMLAQRERLQDNYKQVADDFIAKKIVTEKEIDDQRKENKGKTKSQRQEYTVPDAYFPLSGSGGGSSYRPPKKGNAG